METVDSIAVLANIPNRCKYFFPPDSPLMHLQNKNRHPSINPAMLKLTRTTASIATPYRYSKHQYNTPLLANRLSVKFSTRGLSPNAPVFHIVSLCCFTKLSKILKPINIPLIFFLY